MIGIFVLYRRAILGLHLLILMFAVIVIPATAEILNAGNYSLIVQCSNSTIPTTSPYITTGESIGGVPTISYGYVAGGCSIDVIKMLNSSCHYSPTDGPAEIRSYLLRQSNYADALVINKWTIDNCSGLLGSIVVPMKNNDGSPVDPKADYYALYWPYPNVEVTIQATDLLSMVKMLDTIHIAKLISLD